MFYTFFSINILILKLLILLWNVSSAINFNSQLLNWQPFWNKIAFLIRVKKWIHLIQLFKNDLNDGLTSFNGVRMHALICAVIFFTVSSANICNYRTFKFSIKFFFLTPDKTSYIFFAFFSKTKCRRCIFLWSFLCTPRLCQLRGLMEHPIYNRNRDPKCQKFNCYHFSRIFFFELFNLKIKSNI